MNIKKGRRRIFLVFALSLVLFFFFFAENLYQFFNIWIDKSFTEGLKYLKSLETKGLFLFGAIQFLQVLFGMFPSEVVQATAIVLFRPMYGLLVCYIGSLLGTIVIYFIVKFSKTRYYERRHRDTIEVLDIKTGKRKHIFFKVLRMYTTIFVPLGAVSYYFARKKVKFHKYLLINMFAIIPSLIISFIFSRIIIFIDSISFILLVIVAIIFIILVYFRNYIGKLNVAYKKNIALKPNPYLLKLFKIVGAKSHLINENVVFDVDSIKEVEGPFICICNHPSRFDYLYAMEALNWVSFNFLVDRSYFYKRSARYFLMSLGAIPYNIHSLDVFTMRSMKRAISENRSILIMPEGEISNFARKEENLVSFSKFIKKLGVNVVQVKIDGAGYTCGKYFEEARLGQITVTGSQLFSSDELKELSVEQIDQILDKKMFYDDANYVKADDTLFYETNDICEDLDNILFICPECKSQFTLKTKNNRITCSKCDYEALVNKRYEIYSYNDEGMNLDNIPKFYDFQYNEVFKLVSRKNFYFQENIEIYMPTGKHDYLKEVGTGICIMDSNYFVFTGKINGEKIRIDIPIDELKLNISGFSNMICIYHQNKFYSFKSLDNDKSCIKWYLIYRVLKDIKSIKNS